MITPNKIATWFKAGEEVSLYTWTIKGKATWNVVGKLKEFPYFDSLEAAETYLITLGWNKLN